MKMKRILAQTLQRPQTKSSPQHASCLRSSSSSATTASYESQDTASFDMPKIREEIFQTWMMAEAQSPQGLTSHARYCCFTYEDAKRAYQSPKANWHWLDQELSSNLAGETGAVYVYHGALAGLKLRQQWSSRSSIGMKKSSAISTSKENEDQESTTTSSPTTSNMLYTSAMEFCYEHQATEGQHLRLFQSLVPSHKHTRLAGLWKMAGWTVGFLPSMLGGPRALYVTVEAVETFVEEHFQAQIQRLNDPSLGPPCPELLRLLEYCCADEVHHQQEAAQKLLGIDHEEKASNPSTALVVVGGWWVEPWRRLVHWGSATAAEIARRY